MRKIKRKEEKKTIKPKVKEREIKKEKEKNGTK